MTIFTLKPHNKSCFFPQPQRTHKTHSHSQNPFIKTSFQRFNFHFTPSKLIHRQRTIVLCSTQQDIKENHNKVSKTKANVLPDHEEDVEQQLEGFSVNWPPWKNLPLRYKLIGTTSLAFVICNMDKVLLILTLLFFFIFVTNP
jgi:ACS family sodium-dependent inorganic phosphate cotransporter